jgi:3-deoxy-7-phosphoheptulonate synthase
VRQKLPELVAAVRGCGLPGANGAGVVWICDPMHGNTRALASGVKTRSFDAILEELEATLDILQGLGTPLAGVHFELTDEDVTECLGGSAGVREEDLLNHYATACDPRLNYQQSLEMAFLLARRLGRGREGAGFASSMSAKPEGPGGAAAPDPRSAGL